MSHFLFIFYFSSFICFAYSVTVFRYENCNKGKSITNMTRFIVSPDPISLSKNITISADLYLEENIPLDAVLKAKVYKVTTVFGVKIYLPAPCIRGSGSCNTNHCEYFMSMKEQVCPFFPEGTECGCPLKAGYFRGTNITVPAPQIGSLVKFIASGDFHVEWKLVKEVNHKEQVLACYAFIGTATT